MAKVLNFDCEISEFDLQSCNYDHFRTDTFGEGMNLFIRPIMG